MWRHWFGIVAAVLLISSESAFAQSRVALVIGNSSYQAAVSLPNPVNDGKAVADALDRGGRGDVPGSRGALARGAHHATPGRADRA
jgi:hypothetical protein